MAYEHVYLFQSIIDFVPVWLFAVHGQVIWIHISFPNSVSPKINFFNKVSFTNLFFCS